MEVRRYEMINATTHNSFGPLVNDYRDYFDFTLLFEDTILSIAPSSLLFVVGFARVIHLLRKPKRLLGRNIQYLKLLTIVLYTFSQVVLTALLSKYATSTSKATSAASSLSLVNALLLLALSYLEHGRNIRPSSVLIVYLFFSTAFDIIRLRTIWSIRLPVSVTAISTTSIIIKGIILILEASEKGRYLPNIFNTGRPEEISSILNRGIFYWLNRLLWQGSRGFLAPDNIYDLDTSLTADRLSGSFIQAWLSSRNAKPKNSVIRGLLKSLRWPILAAVFPRIILLVLTVCQPILLQRFLQYLSTAEPKSHSVGRGLVALYALLYFALAVSTGFYWHAHYRALTMLRGCLMSALNWQVTRLDLRAMGDPKAALSLMSSDMEQVLNGLQNLHEFWANLIQIGATGYLLSRQVGVAAVVPAIIALLAAGVATWAGKASETRQKEWMEAVERRISLISSMLPSMKEVKMKGLTEILQTVLVQYRTTELHFARRFRMILIFVSAAGFAPEFLSPPATFLVFLLQSERSHRTFDATKAFTSLTLVIAMTQPLNSLLRCLPSYIGSFASLRRIENFLCAAEQEDFRDMQIGMSSFTPHPSQVTSFQEEEEAIPLSSISRRNQALGSDLASFAIRVKDGCFGWVKGQDVLNDINITIPADKLTFIVGPVASGKSTLCKAFLGETKASKGQVEVRLGRGGISFCDQTPYLSDVSIKDNIIGFCELDETWYKTVLHASALSQDLAMLSQGDSTIVGANGANLSGGQRHKVAFARALYARNEVMILDDIFSGLDANSAEHIFRYGIGPGGLTQKHNMTVIFATHTIKFLPHSQHVIALNTDGRIVQDGTYADLQRRPGYISDLKLAKSERGNDDSDNSEEASTPDTENIKQTADDIISPDNARQQGDFSIYKYYFQAVGLVATILLPFLGAITSTFFNLATVWLKIWTDVTATETETKNWLYLVGYASFQAATLISMLVLVYHVIIRVVTLAGQELHRRLLQSVMDAPLAVFSKTDTGSIINRFSQDMTLIDVQLAMGLVSVVYGVGLLAGQATVIGIASPYTACSYPIIILVFYVIQNFYLKTSRQMRFLDLEAKSPLYTYFLETITGIATLRAFGWTKPNFEAGQELLDRSQKPAYLLYMIQRWLSFVLDTVAACIATIIAGTAVVQNSSSGFAGTALSQLMFVNLMMNSIIMMWTEVETSIGAVSRTKSFVQQTPSEHGPLETVSPPDNWPSNGNIQFRNVTAMYDKENSEQAALRQVNIDISAGEKIGICGRSGSGKSSAILTLFHMLEFMDRQDLNNTILIDGIDIRSIPRNTLRSRLNVLPQHPFFLHGTIRQNLDINTPSTYIGTTANIQQNNSTDQALMDALHKVGLKTLIRDPSDLDTQFDPTTLSHGQRQLFALASAILRKRVQHSKVIVLDEITSNLDRDTDRSIQQIVREEFKHCTVLAVAHRLDTIIDCDRVIVMHEGRVIEAGKPEQLLMKGKDSAFGRMWETAGESRHQDNEEVVVAATPVVNT